MNHDDEAEMRGARWRGATADAEVRTWCRKLGLNFDDLVNGTISPSDRIGKELVDREQRAARARALRGFGPRVLHGVP